MPSLMRILPRRLPSPLLPALFAIRIRRFQDRVLQILLSSILVSAGAVASASQNPPAKPIPPPLVLAGGTIIDLTSSGHSANDIQDAVVFIHDGHIQAVGTRASLPIPKGSQVIDCTGKYLIPGLVDGFAGMSSQGQANANLYMGVTTVVASSDDRRGIIDQHAKPIAPRLPH